MTTTLSHSQSIRTKYIPQTDFKSSRVKAWCERGSITLSWNDALDVDSNHASACDVLRSRFVKEDKAKYGTHKNPWSRPMLGGSLPKPDKGYAFVFIG